MPSFKFDIGEKERVGSRFLSDVRDVLQNALATEKSQRKITQQQIANLLGTSRAVVNRQLLGLENIGIKRVAEILWAIGWEPHFEARPILRGANESPRPQEQLLKREDNDQTASAISDSRKGFQQNNQSNGQSVRSLAQDNAYFDRDRAANR
jgi:transcriptional regulator with XRE-family HTH domain